MDRPSNAGSRQGQAADLDRAPAYAVRKSAEAAEQAKADLRRERGAGVQSGTLEMAEYVVVFTTLSPQELSAQQVLGMYRGRWQIELVFKVLKSLPGAGDLAKYDPDSAKAWLQAKLLTVLILEKLEREARFLSPLGIPVAGIAPAGGSSGRCGTACCG